MVLQKISVIRNQKQKKQHPLQTQNVIHIYISKIYARKNETDVNIFNLGYISKLVI